MDANKIGIIRSSSSVLRKEKWWWCCDADLPPKELLCVDGEDDWRGIIKSVDDDIRGIFVESNQR